MLETAFYTLGVITMGLLLIILLFVLVVVFKIKKNIEEFKRSFIQNVMGMLKERNVEVASALGLTFAHFVIDRIRKSVEKKKS